MEFFSPERVTVIMQYVYVVIILILTFVMAKVTSKIMEKSFHKAARRLKVDKTQFIVLKHILVAMVFVVGVGLAISVVPQLRALSVSLFAGAGVAAVIIGFASQKAFANIVSGVFIAIFKPFRVDDVIKFGERIGKVEDITLRHTVIKNFENKRVIVPNSVMAEEVIENYNINDDRTCKWVEMGISYDSNLDKAMKIMAKEAVAHPLHIDHRTPEDVEAGDPEVQVRVVGFGDSSVILRAWVWAENPKDAFILGCDLRKSIKEKFDKQGIEIPYPYRTIVYKTKKRK